MKTKHLVAHIVEPDLQGELEKGHVRQGVRYLEKILSDLYPNKTSKISGLIFISDAHTFHSDINKYSRIEINPHAALQISRLAFRFRHVLEILFQSSKYEPNHLSTLRIISSKKLWKQCFGSNNLDRTKKIYVTQNIEHIFVPSGKLPKYTYLALRFISKPADSNEEDFLIAIKQLVLRNPGKIHIAFENMKCKEWFDRQNTGIQAYHVPWFGLWNIQSDQELIKSEKIVFPGAQRKAKGIEIIPKIIESIQTKFESKYDFTLQYSSEFDEKFTDLKTNPNVQVLYEEIAHEEYLREINTAKIAILPYDALNYLWTGSGIMADCISGLTYLIAPAGTAIGYEVECFSLGLTYKNIEEIPSLISTINKKSLTFQTFFEYKKLSRDETIKWLSWD